MTMKVSVSLLETFHGLILFIQRTILGTFFITIINSIYLQYNQYYV